MHSLYIGGLQGSIREIRNTGTKCDCRDREKDLILLRSRIQTIQYASRRFGGIRNPRDILRFCSQSLKSPQLGSAFQSFFSDFYLRELLFLQHLFYDDFRSLVLVFWSQRRINYGKDYLKFPCEWELFINLKVFKVETEPSFVKNILSFCSEIRSAISNV